MDEIAVVIQIILGFIEGFIFGYIRCKQKDSYKEIDYD